MLRCFPPALLALLGLLTSAVMPLQADEHSQSKKSTLKADEPTASLLQAAARAGQFKTLISLVIAAELDEALRGDGPFTVFAPTDEAFAKLPKGTVDMLLKSENQDKLKAILLYHVVAGKNGFNFDNAEEEQNYNFKTLNGKAVALTKGDGRFRVNDASIVKKNIRCRNGTVQVIDAVLLPPTSEKTTANKLMTIPELAKTAGTFKTLLAAVTAAELAEVLSGEGPFTVFAPTDDAFAKLPKGTVETLLKPENRGTLVGLLQYHVLLGSVTAKELAKAESIKTLQGERLRVSIEKGRLTVNQSAVSNTDVKASNGLVHVIDTVLMPKH